MCVAWLLTPGGAVKLFSGFDHLGALEKAVRVSWTYLPSELVVGYLTTVKVHVSSSCLEYRDAHQRSKQSAYRYYLPLWDSLCIYNTPILQQLFITLFMYFFRMCYLYPQLNHMLSSTYHPLQ